MNKMRPPCIAIARVIRSLRRACHFLGFPVDFSNVPWKTRFPSMMAMFPYIYIYSMDLV